MAPGNTCLSALSQGGQGTPERPLNDSKGCGGVMRVAPIGLLPALEPANVADVAARAAALTHGHPSGYISAAALAAIIRVTLDGSGLSAAIPAAQRMLPAWKGSEETAAKVNAALSASRRTGANRRQAIAALGGAWTGEEALAIGIYSALVGKSFPEVFSIVANHDGDSDSTASIAGQIYGAQNGISDLPN
jgi:ADP-ribosylglycohydrolase